jgi:hypothetical protein
VALKKRLHPRQAGLANCKLSRLNLRSRVASAAPSSMKRKVARWVTARMLQLKAGGARGSRGKAFMRNHRKHDHGNREVSGGVTEAHPSKLDAMGSFPRCSVRQFTLGLKSVWDPELSALLVKTGR